MKCHWCNKQLCIRLQDHEDRIYECEDGHCIITFAKDRETIKKYQIFIYADKAGKARFFIAGSKSQGTRVYARTSSKSLQLQFTFDYIPISVDNNDVIKVSNLLNAEKLKKYILFS